LNENFLILYKHSPCSSWHHCIAFLFNIHFKRYLPLKWTQFVKTRIVRLFHHQNHSTDFIWIPYCEVHVTLTICWSSFVTVPFSRMGLVMLRCDT
jgi:hypothetical protein